MLTKGVPGGGSYHFSRWGIGLILSEYSPINTRRVNENELESHQSPKSTLVYGAHYADKLF